MTDFVNSFAGNGAAQALEDVAVLKVLFLELSSPDRLPAMLEAYDQIRRPRSQKVVQISRQFGRINLMLDQPDHISTENIAQIRKIYAEGASYTNDVDIEAQNLEALKAFEGIR